MDNKLIEEVVNATPHDIKVKCNNGFRVFPKSEKPARLEIEDKDDGIIQDEDACMEIPVRSSVVTGVENYPIPEEGRVYIVSRFFASKYPDRDKKIIPGKLIRDEDGNPKGCEYLTRV